MFFTHYYLLAIFPVLLKAWDIAVLTEDEIEFLDHGKLVGVIGNHLKQLSAATYDPIKGDLFVSDSNQQNASIFRINMLSSNEKEDGFQPIVSRQAVQGIVYDPVTSYLFWSTGISHTIRRLHYENTNSAITTIKEGEVLHQFKNEIPQGIAVDSCRQYVYWTNCYHLKPSIERSLLNGSNREVIIKDQLFQPLGISIDQDTKKIYWSDAQEGIYYSIERSDLDGKNRQTLMHGTHHQPFAITVISDRVYWSDWVNKALWSLPKDSVGGIQPQDTKLFHNKLPMGVISNILYFIINEKECAPLIPFKRKINENMPKWTVPRSRSTKYGPTDSSQSATSSVSVNICLNNGSLRTDGECDCLQGYSGLRCEVSSCHNYCLFGNCTLNTEGSPQCECPIGTSGFRCEENMCSRACLNDGVCHINELNQVTCKCLSEYTGKKCEWKTSMLDELCKGYCEYKISQETRTSPTVERSVVNYVEKSTVKPSISQICSCSKYVESLKNVRYDVDKGVAARQEQSEEQKQQQELVGKYNKANVIITSSLSIICVILLVTVVLLLTRVCKLRKRPRIHKRIVINKPPVSCRPPQSSPSDQCEITIENCCNMNICETPCFEPEFRTSKATFNKRKMEDKKMLIDNIVNGNSSQDEDMY